MCIRDSLGAVLLCHHDDLLVGDDVRQRGILHQRDDLVAHRGQDAFDDLQERDLEEDLAPGHAQHLTGLGLAFRHILDAAAVDLREVAGVVDGESHHRRHQTARRAGGPGVGHTQQAGSEVDDDDLEHQRRTADDPHEGLDDAPQRCAPAHGAKGHHKAQRQRKQQGQKEQLTVERECAGQTLQNHSHRITTPIRL